MHKARTHGRSRAHGKSARRLNDPRANIYSPLTLNFASILVNCGLVRPAIIQTGNANVNELRFAYLYFPMVEMSLVMTLDNEECHS